MDRINEILDDNDVPHMHDIDTDGLEESFRILLNHSGWMEIPIADKEEEQLYFYLITTDCEHLLMYEEDGRMKMVIEILDEEVFYREYDDESEGYEDTTLHKDSVEVLPELLEKYPN